MVKFRDTIWELGLHQVGGFPKLTKVNDKSFGTVQKWAKVGTWAGFAGLLAVSPVMGEPVGEEELEARVFSKADLTPDPACLSVTPDGQVFVGVDMLGSLGKGPGKGRIMRLVDEDGDGQADSHTVFAKVDNPRGLFAVGPDLYVIHTVIPESTGILEGLHLSKLSDVDGDGKADGEPEILVTDFSSLKPNQDRGADHTTNGIRMGIDGWIYVAVGDFGFPKAKGTDGKELNLLGGGVVRVRPDGSEMEIYTSGLRNIYDVAIDPFLNLYTRGNTNDGGGWDVRFAHHIQSGEYGYPRLFKNFTSEILPALADLGGGSGAGALFLDEPSWKGPYAQSVLTADWGRSTVFRHPLIVDQASFQHPREEAVIQISQPTDLDVDGSGRLYVASWDGAGYKGNPERGAVGTYLPKGWSYKPYPKAQDLSLLELLAQLGGESAVGRLAAQQEILRRGDLAAKEPLEELMGRAEAGLAQRVAALFTYKQLLGEASHARLLELCEDAALQEFALRALSDRLSEVASVPVEPFLKGLKSENPRVQAAAMVGLGRLGRSEVAGDILQSVTAPPYGLETVAEGPKPAFRSPPVTKDHPAPIEVDIRGWKDFYLVVQPDGPSEGDHAGWFDLQLFDPEGKEAHFGMSIVPKAKVQQSGKTNYRKNPDGSPIARMDGKPFGLSMGTHAYSRAHFQIRQPVSKLKAVGALTNTASPDARVIFEVYRTRPFAPGEEVGAHATPNSSIILPHLAVKSLVRLGAVEACLDALDGPHADLAFRALQEMSTDHSVEGLLEKAKTTSEAATQRKIRRALARLHLCEAPYDGTWWWGTKPDTRGPYYVPVPWEKSAEIEAFFRENFESGGPELKEELRQLADLHRMNLPGIGGVEKMEETAQKKVGQISIEDLILMLDKRKGSAERGQKVLRTLSCLACHNFTPDEALRGPDLSDLGARMKPAEIAEAVLKPDATISPQWVDVTLKAGGTRQGTLVAKTDQKVVLRDIAGNVAELAAAEVAKISPAVSSIMTPHLLDALTEQEYVDVITYLSSLK